MERSVLRIAWFGRTNDKPMIEFVIELHICISTHSQRRIKMVLGSEVSWNIPGYHFLTFRVPAYFNWMLARPRLSHQNKL